MTAIEAAGVVIPACNEAEMIAACIKHVRAAADRVAPLPVRIIVVDDGSADSTAATAAAASADVIVPGHDRPNVGAARAWGADAVFCAFEDVPLERLWLAFTDADTNVPRDWLETQLAHAAAGRDAVAGVVRLANCSPKLYQRFVDSYREGISALSHNKVHGANLGCRASAYRAVGGFQAIACGEDNDLWQRLQTAGLSLISDPGLRVTTSARTTSRTQGGFATDLARLVSDNPGTAPDGPRIVPAA